MEDITDQGLEDVSPILARTLLRSRDITLITRKENRSKKMILAIPHRHVWECPCDTQFAAEFNKPHLYGIFEGVVQMEPDYLKNFENLYVEVTARYRYQKGEHVQFDHNVNRVEYHDYYQLSPPPPRTDKRRVILYSRVTLKMKEKFGPYSYPFQFDLRGSPDSVRYYEHDDSYCKNGVTWKVRAFVAQDLMEPSPRDAIEIKFRKLSFMRPHIQELGINLASPLERRLSHCCRDGGRVELKAILDKQIYYFGETIPVSVIVNNLSDRVIKSLVVTVEQIQTITQWTQRRTQQKVSEIIFTGEDSKYPLIPSKKWRHVVNIKPGTELTKNFSNLLVEYPPEPVSGWPERDMIKPGTVIYNDFEELITQYPAQHVNGWRDCCLAASTIRQFQDPKKETDNLNVQPGVTNVFYNDACLSISYQVMVKCIISEGDQLYVPDVRVCVDFILAHKEPEIIRAHLKDAKLVD